MPTEKENCPLCLAAPADWVDEPHEKRDALFLALADLRRVVGCDERPMLSELPQVVSERIGELEEALDVAVDQLTNAKGELQCLGRELDNLNQRHPHLVGALLSDDAISGIEDALTAIRRVLHSQPQESAS